EGGKQDRLPRSAPRRTRNGGVSRGLSEEARRAADGIGWAASEFRSAAESWDPSDDFALPGGDLACRLRREANDDWIPGHRCGCSARDDGYAPGMTVTRRPSWVRAGRRRRC